jgi:hypothetical protein
MSLNRKDISTANKSPQLQHRHFALIAAAMRDSKPGTNWDPNKRAQWESTINSFIEIGRRSNDKFDAERFRAACNHERERS